MHVKIKFSPFITCILFCIFPFIQFIQVLIFDTSELKLKISLTFLNYFIIGIFMTLLNVYGSRCKKKSLRRIIIKITQSVLYLFLVLVTFQISVISHYTVTSGLIFDISRLLTLLSCLWSLLIVKNIYDLIIFFLSSKISPRQRSYNRIIKITHIKCPICGYFCQKRWKICPICNTLLNKERRKTPINNLFKETRNF